MAFHRNNNGPNNRYGNNRQNFRPRHNNNHHQQQGGQGRRHVNRINHVFESNGPDGRVRGTAQQLVEKYVGLARDAHAGGDPVLMLNYYQHAEHYQRLYTEIMEENGAFERERDASRAQTNQQPQIEGEGNFAPDTQPNMDEDNMRSGRREPRQMADRSERMSGDRPNESRSDNRQPDNRQTDNRQSENRQGDGRMSGNRMETRQPETRQPDTALTPQQPADSFSEAGAMSTGGRVLGRRPAAPRGEGRAASNQQANQLQDDHMPSFLKQDIPIKQTPPAKPATRVAKPATAPGKEAPAQEAAVVPAAETAPDTTGPATAFGKRRAPARRLSADKTGGDNKPDETPDSTETE